ncbi:hypothetical protein HHK36_007551 [Tetracentron sinense]|uniref:Uncharacterized protein n=1 Tax=Tetracentron sinense TaxID=13715 RepID=A0A834ZJZ8_TETSI|nr:hypothetical protein HHK36_007551 [Tetracentron sinense]
MAGNTQILPNSSQDHASIEIPEPDNLLATLSQTTPLSSRCCIYKVSNTVGIDIRNAYEPQTVSIGPFHHDKESCKATKRFKLLYLNSLLDRAPTLHTNVESLMEAITSLEQVSRECYEENNLTNLTSKDLVEMMVIDGCFILEMLRREADEVPISENDPVFRTAQMHFKIKRDIILVENQIPLLILQCLFDLTTAPEQECFSLIELCLHYLDTIMPMDEGIGPGYTNTSLNPNHLLDVFHNSFISPTITMLYDTIEHINCATELHEAGVTFKKNDNASSLFD